ncbi:glycosyltransferase [Williamsia sp. MIQD14]|uniref:glycosyltransferase n=1 Tax=Williamsia sp. MIQD14 TaxID=3425703 RepID=UPI003DA039DB
MIGYYVHHHGVGHMTRSASIAAALDEPVTVLSSRRPPADHPAVDWLDLPLDVPADPLGDTAADPTAHGAVHWAPTDVVGLTDRMAAVAAWIARVRPSAVVVDVSVEMTVFVRLMGVPVVVMAMPGDRTDSPHELAHRIADRIVAPWSRGVYDPAHLHPFAAKTRHVGSISRFADRTRDPAAIPLDPTVLVLGGAGGSAVDTHAVEAAARACPDHRWRFAGPGSWVDDVWPLLHSASVVVTHAGQNAVADVACAATPAVVIPQDRPFGEQNATAEALSRNSIAVTLDTWPAPEAWPRLLAEASAIDTTRWKNLQTDGAADRAAAVVSDLIAEVAR